MTLPFFQPAESPFFFFNFIFGYAVNFFKILDRRSETVKSLGLSSVFGEGIDTKHHDMVITVY